MSSNLARQSHPRIPRFSTRQGLARRPENEATESKRKSADDLSLMLEDEFSELSAAAVFGAPEHRPPARIWRKSLFEPIRDFFERPRKEFRARLTEVAFIAAGGAHVPRELTAVVEVLHAGSLVVDDIEDGSADRRGQPALHVRYGIPTALNAGNFLYFWAPELLERLDLEPLKHLEALRRMQRTLRVCHHGQALDLSLHLGDLAQREVRGSVEAVTRQKTGALMRFSAELGALVGGAEPKFVSAFGRLGEQLGVALQMLDDLGGLSSARRLVKGHEDLCLGRVTWPWAWLSESMDELSFARLSSIGREVQRGDTHPELLAQRILEALGERGSVAIDAVLDGALEDIRSTVGQKSVLERFQDELKRLRRSYE